MKKLIYALRFNDIMLPKIGANTAGCVNGTFQIL